MSSVFARTVLSLFFFFAFLLFAPAQKEKVGTKVLLQQYNTAQAYYNNATRLSGKSNYGSKEEALEKKWNEAALQGYQRIYREVKDNGTGYDSLRFYLCFRIGELFHYFENASVAVQFYREAIAVQSKSGLADSLLFKPCLYTGIIFYNQNKFDTAEQFFKKAERVQAGYKTSLPESERLYNLLGVLYFDRGNYRQAENYFQKALQSLPRSNPYYKELLVNYTINLAQLHLRLEEYGKANAIYTHLLLQKTYLNEIYHNIGYLNLLLGEPAKAVGYLKKVTYRDGKLIRLYNSTGEAFFKMARFDSALIYYNKAAAAYERFGVNSDPVGYGLLLKNTGDYFRRLGRNEKALQYYQGAVHQFYPAFTQQNIDSNPEKFSGLFSYINLFYVLLAKAETWQALYAQNKDRRAAQQALAVYRSAFKLIDYVERTYESDEARLFLTKTIYAVHDKPINLAFELYQQTNDEKYLSLLYSFDQQNKAAVLALNRQLNTALEGNTSPLVQKERDVKSEITRLSIKASQTTDNAQLTFLNNSIRDYEIELGKLQQNLYPKEALKEDIPSLRLLRDTFLDEKTVLVSYHLSPEKLTTLVVAQNAVRCYQQALPQNFTSLVQQEILSLKTPSAKPAQTKTATLYNLLLANVPLQDKEQQLIIIPGDVLAYLPFESLQNSEGKFLIQQAAVQYQFSTALLTKNETDFARAETLSFAPFAKQSYTNSLSLLPASAQETEGLRGNRFLDTAATKEKFLALAPSFPVVHLATHAVVNDSADNFSYIAFAPAPTSRDNLLYAQEIYNLRLQKTGLVILSACETGAGSLVKGEGVLSLSRAFAYAGCPNVITSLWKADDFSTAYLTGRIHGYLAEGWSIAKAVQKAKLDYLSDRTVNPRLKQPYYWSHLVFVGAYQPEKSGQWVWYPAGGLIVLALLLFYRLKPRRAGQ